MKKETVIVTGGAGFIGSHIADRLIEEGYRVVVIDNLSTGNKSNLPKNAVFYHLDIQDPKLASVFEKERPAFVSHHAAQAGVRPSVEDPIFDAKNNILGTIQVLQNCVQYGVKKFMFASSGGALYREVETLKNRCFPASETHPIDPLSPYGISKLSGEYYVRFFHKTYGLPYAILRYANVYGPRQDPFGEAGVVAIFIEQMRDKRCKAERPAKQGSKRSTPRPKFAKRIIGRGERSPFSEQMLHGDQPVIFGDGQQTRDFIFIDDVVNANALAMKHEASDIFNIGTGVETSVNEIFDQLKALINPAIEKKYGPAKSGEQRRSVIDPAKVKKLLHWFPKISLQEGLKKTVNYAQYGLCKNAISIPDVSFRASPRVEESLGGGLGKAIPPLGSRPSLGRNDTNGGFAKANCIHLK